MNDEHNDDNNDELSGSCVTITVFIVCLYFIHARICVSYMLIFKFCSKPCAYDLLFRVQADHMVQLTVFLMIFGAVVAAR